MRLSVSVGKHLKFNLQYGSFICANSHLYKPGLPCSTEEHTCLCVHKYTLPINMLVHNGQTRELESVWQPDIYMLCRSVAQVKSTLKF